MTSEQRIIFSEIYISNHPKLLRYAKANKLCASVAEELVQDTFHDAWSKFGELINHENIGGWLMQTLKNKMRNYTRTKRREANLLVDHGDRSEDIAAPGNFINALIVSDALSAIYRFVYDNFKEDDITLFRRIFIEMSVIRKWRQNLELPCGQVKNALSEYGNELGKNFLIFNFDFMSAHRRHLHT